MDRKSSKLTVRNLLGHWQSDRKRTLEYWAFPRTASARARKLFQSKNFFGKLRWQFTPTRLRHSYQGETRVAPYRVLWSDQYHVAILIGKGRNASLRDIHFDGNDSFYILAGKANCEFFKRVRANTSLERTRGR
jgi:hypothetical protein